MKEERKTEGIRQIREFLTAHPVLFASVTGFDDRPQIHAAQFCFADEEALYFAGAKCESFYGQLSLSPVHSLGAYDPDTGQVLTLNGEAVFTEEKEIVSRCLETCPALKKKWEHQPEMVIAWFLKNARAEFTYLDREGQEVIELGTPGNALVGIEIRKDKEIRDRLTKIMERREEEAASLNLSNEEERFLQKLYDGAVLYFAETARGVWPRMDIQPIERSLLYETYDEREEFTGLARKLIGNTLITKPEDLTCWLNKETLSDLYNS